MPTAQGLAMHQLLFVGAYQSSNKKESLQSAASLILPCASLPTETADCQDWIPDDERSRLAWHALIPVTGTLIVG